MTTRARPTLPPGKDIDNLHARAGNLPGDTCRSGRKFSGARFEVPTVGDADTLSSYIEAKYKVTTQFFGAVRWNEQFYGNVPAGGSQQPWGNDIWRVDAALGYRFTDYLQTKIQYSFSHQDAPLQQGEQLVAGQLTIKF
jgi:hypothetical protein